MGVSLSSKANTAGWVSVAIDGRLIALAMIQSVTSSLTQDGPQERKTWRVAGKRIGMFHRLRQPMGLVAGFVIANPCTIDSKWSTVVSHGENIIVAKARHACLGAGEAVADDLTDSELSFHIVG